MPTMEQLATTLMYHIKQPYSENRTTCIEVILERLAKELAKQPAK
jgi:hypothetical protein